jgi:Tfp pilus assembly protein PilF
MAADLIVRRGFEELRAGRPEAALREAQRALRFGPDRNTTHELFANAYFLRGSFSEALRHYKMAIRNRADRPSLRNNYGVALLRIGRPEEAAREFEAALRLDPNHARARGNLERARAALAGRELPESPNER